MKHLPLKMLSVRTHRFFIFSLTLGADCLPTVLQQWNDLQAWGQQAIIHSVDVRLLISTQDRLWQLLMSNCRHPQGARQYLTHKNSSKKKNIKRKPGQKPTRGPLMWRLWQVTAAEPVVTSNRAEMIISNGNGSCCFHLFNDSQVELKDNQLWFLRSCLPTAISSLCPRVNRNNRSSSYQGWQPEGLDPQSGTKLPQQMLALKVFHPTESLCSSAIKSGF